MFNLHLPLFNNKVGDTLVRNKNNGKYQFDFEYKVEIYLRCGKI